MVDTTNHAVNSSSRTLLLEVGAGQVIMNSDLTWVDVAHCKLAFDWFILVM